MSKIGIMAAMPEEIDQLFSYLENVTTVEEGSRKYLVGKLFGKEVVAVFSRWGKVAAATTATHLINQFGVSQLIFTGVAGAIAETLKVGDIVIGERLYQHDMDARPLMPRFEIPLTGKNHFQANATINKELERSVNAFLNNNPEFISELERNSIDKPNCYVGDIASGDLFVAGKSMRDAIARNLPSVLCVEMEGAAVAQVCDDYQVDVAVIRFISDTADNDAHLSATDFLLHHASSYSLGILKEYLKNTPPH